MTCSTTSSDSQRLGSMIRRVSALGLCCLALLGASSAQAEPSASDRAIARTLFEQGRALMKEKRHREACPKFEESQRLFPAGGTLLNMALCHEEIGRTASAWTEFNDVATLSRQEGKEDREKFAREHLEALTPLLSRLTIAVPDSVASRPVVSVKLDGAPIGKAAWGTAFPVDPGEHVVEVTGPGIRTWSTTVSVAKSRANATVTVPEEIGVASSEKPVSSAPLPAASSPPGAGPTGPTLPSPAEQTAHPARGSTQLVLGLVSGGVGVAGIIAGSFFGLRANAKERDSESHCRPDDPTICSAEGVALIDEGKTAATISTVAFVAGGVALAAGAVLLITAPRSDPGPTSARRNRAISVLPDVGSSNATLWIRGSF